MKGKGKRVKGEVDITALRATIRRMGNYRPTGDHPEDGKLPPCGRPSGGWEIITLRVISEKILTNF